ncbi:MAG TPA: V-type ATP synthase subunit E family protein [Nitrosopumilaceae archaeon]|nr:V-type ATP synthase subunit E family protein [Nitrosopumilaceae archaeon]
MTSSPALEKTVDKILNQSENELLSSLKQSLDDSKSTLSNSLSSLEQEYDRILADGKKEADKLQKQISGSAALEARNKQLLLVEDSVEKVFTKAIEKLNDLVRNEDYTKLVTQLLDESVKGLGTSNVIVECNSKDKSVVQSILSKFSGATLSSNTINCLGGVIVKSKDGSMSFDNTIDARIERLKPLIRKDIAIRFGR